jgi:hypothetical protein
VLTARTARLLRDAGLAWAPQSGDRFVLADRDMDDEVFVLSEMVVEHHRAATGGLLRFNGTTEWALDQVQVEQALWLPREEQLRTALGERFVALARNAGGWVVTTTDGELHQHEDAEGAYAAALLPQLAGSTSTGTDGSVAG